MRILGTSDLHIGRRPTRTPRGFDGKECTPAAVWAAMVKYAVEANVDVVALSGDIVDRDNRFFEAFGCLERGIRDLADAGIDVCAVAGNHDFDVLPRLARSVCNDRFHLLGTGGRWERVTLSRPQGALNVDGWSFPTSNATSNPLEEYPAWRESSLPTLGLLHADINQPVSRYAPVALEDLRAASVSLWILGHVHKPTPFLDGARLVALYPGSLQALDPGEPGLHGPWLMDIGQGQPRPAQLPLARVRYDRVEVDLTGAMDEDEAEGRIVHAVREALRAARGATPELLCLCCRVRLMGWTRMHRRLRVLATQLETDALDIQDGQACACVEKVEIETRPEIDLDTLVRGSGPPALLAATLRDLRDGSSTPDVLALLTDARRCNAQVQEHRSYRELESACDEDDEALRIRLSRQGYLLLDTLLAQKDG